jgi:transposase
VAYLSAGIRYIFSEVLPYAVAFAANGQDSVECMVSSPHDFVKRKQVLAAGSHGFVITLAITLASVWSSRWSSHWPSRLELEAWPKQFIRFLRLSRKSG